MTILDAGVERRPAVRALCTSAATMTAGMAVASAAATLVASDAAGSGVAGLPSTAGIVGTGLGAAFLPRLLGRAGRRRGLLTGYGVALVGAAVAAAAAAGPSALALPGLVLGLLLLGAGNGAAQLTRYLAGDLYPADRRGRAIALVVAASTVGAVGGPVLLTVADPFLIVGAAVLVAVLAAATGPTGPPRPVQAVGVRALLADRDARPALVAMVGAQVVMVAVMTAAPLDMHHHGSGLGAIGLVLSAHTLGMFAVAPLSGRLADRFGAPPVMLAGLCLGAGASAFAAAASGTGDGPHGVVYFALGVAWNLAFVGGSTALSRGADDEHRLALEGAVDAAVWGVAAVAGATSTVLLAAGGFPLLGGLAAAVAVAAAAAVSWLAPPPARRADAGRR